MRAYSLSHLSDAVLLRDLASLVERDRITTAAMLAHIAEVDSRRLYLPAAYPSMHSYCVHELRLSEDSAYRRITAARAAREHPLLFEALADGRLHLSALSMLAPHLNPENVAELLRGATHKSKSEIEELIARRFPRTELLPLVQPIPARSYAADELVPGRAESGAAQAHQLVPGRVEPPSVPSTITPLAPQRFTLQLSIGQSVRDKLRRAQELLGHKLPSGDIGAVIELALDALIANEEKRKFAAASRPQRKPRTTRGDRHVPARVKREVAERDGGQCTFVSDAGRRCAARTRLEFDHVNPVARGGEATVDNLRLRCRAHNQFTAERDFGAEFMSRKRDESRRRADTAASQRATDQAAAERELVPCLRQLGYRADEARAAARFGASPPDASLEQRVRMALSYFRPKITPSRNASGALTAAPLPT